MVCFANSTLRVENMLHVYPTTLIKDLALIYARSKKVLGFKKLVDLFEFSLLSIALYLTINIF